MNRRERHAARSRNIVLIDLGYLDPRDPNHGLSVNCLVCSTSHSGLGIARIQHGKEEAYVPLCEPCLAAEGTTDRIARKYLNAPDLTISEGGELSAEQLAAMAGKPTETEH